MLLLANAVAILTLAYSAQSAPRQFVPIKLPLGVQIELPRGWEVRTRNQRVGVESLSAYFDASLNNDFTANHFDATGLLAASVHVGYYRSLDLTQADAWRADAAEIAKLDAFLQTSVTETGRSGGYSILAWHGTTRQTFNGLTAFVSEYSRTLLRQPGSFRVRLVRVFDGPRSFTLNVSYRESDQHRLRPLCDRIVASLAISNNLGLFSQSFSGAAGR